jgi:glycosyltransferase involved in cell wall biosynthesis
VPCRRLILRLLDLSVVIPAYNVADTLAEQLDALLAQDWAGAWEVVVVDNRSTDGTASLVHEYATRDPRVRLVSAPDRAGRSYARDVGIKAATADTIAFCDGDDIVGPRWLTAMGDGLREHRVVTGPLDSKRLNPAWLAGTRGDMDTTTARTWFGLFPLVASGDLGVRRDVFTEVGTFDDRYATAEDHEFSLRLWQHEIPIAFAPDALLHYRFRTEGRDLWQQGNGYGEMRPLLRRAVADAGLTPPSRFAGWRSWAWLVLHGPELLRERGRARWLWVAGNRVGQLRGSIRARSLFL